MCVFVVIVVDKIMIIKLRFKDVGQSGESWEMFRGAHAVTVDSKGRIAVPARYRPLLQEAHASHVVVTIDTEDPCLLMYPMGEWHSIEAKVEALPSFNPVTRRIKRLLIGHATELELDSQGRVLLAILLREHAQLNKRVMLVGQGRKFEIWDEAQWLSQRQGWLEAGTFQSGEVPDEINEISV